MNNFMEKDAKIFVAGHRGLAGGAIARRLEAQGYHNLLRRTRQETDLLERDAVRQLFAAEKPEYVFLAAAKVGGILANRDFPAEFIAQNLRIQSNVIEAAYEYGVKRLLFLGSSCIYPKLAPQPIAEEQLLTGPLEFTNRSYAVAKIAGIEMCWAFNRQYGTNYLAAMPTNLYGPGDSYDPHNSHVLPALIRKVDAAKREGAKKLTVWGTGTPLREFLYSEDMADACIYLLNLPEDEFRKLTADPERAPLVNVGSGTDLSIAELARTVCRVLGFDGELEFDRSKPDGTPRKLMDNARLAGFGWRPRVPLEEGIRRAYEDFRIRWESGKI